MWRFIRDMKAGDYVVVPHETNFYVAQVEGPAFHDPEKVEEDTAFRRKVKWLNEKQPIPRAKAPSALYSRMKILGVSANAYDLVDDIRSILENIAAGIETTFAEQLTEKLAVAALEQMRRGFMNERKFEKLVELILKRLGATTTLTPRAQDKGDDVVGSFKHLGLTLVAQVKYHTDPNWETDKDAVQQVVHGIEKHQADVGWVVTCGRFSENAKQAVTAKPIRLIEGDELAKMVVAFGVEHIQYGLER